MKFPWNNKYKEITLYACGISAFTVVIIYLLMNIKGIGDVFGNVMGILTPLTVGFIIAYLLNPVMKFCENRFLGRFIKKEKHAKLLRVLSMVCAYIFFLLIITLIIQLLIPQVVTSYHDFLSGTSGYVSSVEIWITEHLGGNGIINTDKLIESLNGIIENSYDMLTKVTPFITGFLGNFIVKIKDAVIGIVVSVYMLYSKEHLAGQFKKILYAVFPERISSSIHSFFRCADKTFGGFIVGKIIDSVIIGILTFIVLAVVKMPYYQLVSVIVGVTNIIPFFGPFIGAIPSAFIIFMANPVKALWFALIILLIQQLDGNVIGPKILGDSVGVSSLGIIVAITVTSGLFGIVGMFIGVPLYALFIKVFEKLISYLEMRKSASETVEKIETETEGAEEQP